MLHRTNRYVNVLKPTLTTASTKTNLRATNMTDNVFLNTDWMDAQKKYWQTWTDMGLNAMNNRPNMATSPWEGALNHWWSALNPTAPAASRDFIDKLMDQSKRFMRVSDDIYRNMGSTGMGLEEWNNLIQKTFGDPFKTVSNPNDHTAAMRRMLAFWEMPLDTWQRMASTLSLMPGDALRNMPHEHIQDNLQRVLTAPGLGYTREQQSQYNEFTRCAMQYQAALNEYMQFFSKLGFKSSERMRERLMELNSQGTVIDTARGLYDLWVDCCEKVYAEQIMTHEYAMLHGKLINALMAFKHRLSVIVDESLGALNMPTRTELRTLQDRLQETRRENKQLRHDLEALRQLVTALDAGRTPAGTVALAAATNERLFSMQRNSQTKETDE